jgi:hypothetical protein
MQWSVIMGFISGLIDLFHLNILLFRGNILLFRTRLLMWKTTKIYNETLLVEEAVWYHDQKEIVEYEAL